MADITYCNRWRKSSLLLAHAQQQCMRLGHNSLGLLFGGVDAAALLPQQSELCCGLCAVCCVQFVVCYDDESSVVTRASF